MFRSTPFVIGNRQALLNRGSKGLLKLLDKAFEAGLEAPRREGWDSTRNRPSA